MRMARHSSLLPVIAYDVVIRTAQAIDAGVMKTLGFHRTGTNGAFGAVAGAAKILCLDPDQTTNAFGIVGSQSLGSLQGTDEGVWTKRFNPGWAAHNGVTAATLAQMGFAGPREIFEGKRGLYNAYPKRATTWTGSSTSGAPATRSSTPPGSRARANATAILPSTACSPSASRWGGTD